MIQMTKSTSDIHCAWYLMRKDEAQVNEQDRGHDRTPDDREGRAGRGTGARPLARRGHRAGRPRVGSAEGRRPPGQGRRSGADAVARRRHSPGHGASHGLGDGPGREDRPSRIAAEPHHAAAPGRSPRSSARRKHARPPASSRIPPSARTPAATSATGCRTRDCCTVRVISRNTIPENGASVIDGPAPRPLPALPLRIADGQLVVAGPFTARVTFDPA